MLLYLGRLRETAAPEMFLCVWVAQVSCVDLLQDLVHEFMAGIRIFIWSLRSKVCVLKSGGPDREPPGASEEPRFRAFSTQDENKVTFLFRISFGVTF